MSVRVRLTRVGSKKNPIWRVVVADQRSPRDGRYIESIGHYNPQTEPSTIRIDEERLQHWLARGAQPTGSVKHIVKAYAKSGGAGGGDVGAQPATSAPPVAAVPADAGEGEPASAAPGEPGPGADDFEAEPTDAPTAEPPDPAADAEDAVDAVEGEAP